MFWLKFIIIFAIVIILLLLIRVSANVEYNSVLDNFRVVVKVVGIKVFDSEKQKKKPPKPKKQKKKKAKTETTKKKKTSKSISDMKQNISLGNSVIECDYYDAEELKYLVKTAEELLLMGSIIKIC